MDHRNIALDQILYHLCAAHRESRDQAANISRTLASLDEYV